MSWFTWDLWNLCIHVLNKKLYLWLGSMFVYEILCISLIDNYACHLFIIYKSCIFYFWLGCLYYYDVQIWTHNYNISVGVIHWHINTLLMGIICWHINILAHQYFTNGDYMLGYQYLISGGYILEYR